MIRESLVKLMTRSLSQEITQPVEVKIEQKIEEEKQESQESKLVTTAEEIEAFKKIKAITQTSRSYNLEPEYKDTVSSFGINLVGKSTAK